MAIDDETLMAFLDGEIDELRRRRIEQALVEDADLRTRLEAQRRLRERLAAHYGPVADEAVPERLRTMLETNVVELRRAPRPPVWRWTAALAASLVLGLVIGRSLPQGGPVTTSDGMLIARGDFARALDRQLASAQAGDSETRIGVSFARSDGVWCRSFERADLAGIACREQDVWRLVTTAPGAGPERVEYRQAASGSRMVMQAAQELMAADALDADAERRIRDSGWQAGTPVD